MTTFRMELGAYYRLRSGVKAGPLLRNDNPFNEADRRDYPWKAACPDDALMDSMTFTAKGTYLTCGVDEDTPPGDDYDIVGYWVEGIDRECAPTPPEESILLRKRRRKPRAIDNAPPWADITIYESPVLVMAMRDVDHILKLKTQCGNPNGLHIITAATRYDFKNDNWSNPAYVPNDEAAAFIRQWKAYRAKLDGYDIAVAMDDRKMDILEMQQAAYSALPPDGYRSEESPF